MKFFPILILNFLFFIFNCSAQSGVNDPTFDPGTGVNGYPLACAIQSDGKIIIGGGFTTYNGTAINRIARLNADGSLDGSFNPGTGANNSVISCAIQSNGKIIIGGDFTSYNGTAINCIARLNADGSLDGSFNPAGQSVYGNVETCAVQSDGKIIIGGFNLLPNVSGGNYIARLNADGSLDTSFNIGTGPDNMVRTCALQSDGKIIIGGDFIYFNGTSAPRFARLNADGSVDTGFNPGWGLDGMVVRCALQSDGKIVIVGYFSSYNGTSRNCIARLNADGSLDTGFNPGLGAPNGVFTCAIQSDGKIIIGGGFTSYNGTSINCLARLNTNGSLDTGFNPGSGANGYVETCALQSDGNIFIGGGFFIYNGAARNGVARVINTTWAGTNNLIAGQIFADVNGDCVLNENDFGLRNYLVRAEPGPFYGLSDNNGNYVIYTDTGSYTVSQLTQNSLWQQTCQQTHQVVVANAFDNIYDINFTNQALYYCSNLFVDIGVSPIRRCMNSYYHVNYCNNGTAIADDAFITIDFDSNVTPQSSSIPWNSVTNNSYTFPVGDLNLGECGNFSINVGIDCSTENGSMLCAHATIFPDTVCVPPDSAYDRRQLIILGECLQNDSVQYVIKNTHNLNITHTGEYKIYVNNALALVNPYVLGQGDSLIVQFPANGNTIRLEVTFIDFNGTYIGPQVTIEGCGGNPGIQGMVGQLPENDDAANFETVCQFVTGSFDPNDKAVRPIGLTSMHYIDDTDELEYVIRFQNTGTDTAFTVVIRDTISPFLDLATLVSGASSHSYTFTIYGQGIAEWTFSNILLPDSNINEPLSHGFVKYKIKQIPGNAQGTSITNSADIYFDFNEPVITNTTENIVHDTVLLCLYAVPAFDFTQTGASFEFINNSDYATSYLWSFGDGNTTTAENPSYAFTTSGNYSVCLSANNDCGTDSICRIVKPLRTGVDNINVNAIRIIPNPAISEVTVSGYNPAYLKLTNALGQTVAEAHKSNKLYVGNLPQGIYVLQLFDANGLAVKTEKVIIAR